MNLGNIGIEFKDVNNKHPLNQQIFADVILIDRSSSAVNPFVYILKNDRCFTEDDFEAIKNGCLSFDKESFIFIGEVDTIKKKQKILFLTNQNCITYKRLIIASGFHHSSLLSYEFLAGVQTLINALRVQKKIPSSFAQTKDVIPQRKKKKTSPSIQVAISSQDKEITVIEKLGCEVISPCVTQDNIHIPRRLYEVQI